MYIQILAFISCLGAKKAPESAMDPANAWMTNPPENCALGSRELQPIGMQMAIKMAEHDARRDLTVNVSGQTETKSLNSSGSSVEKTTTTAVMSGSSVKKKSIQNNTVYILVCADEPPSESSAPADEDSAHQPE